MNLIEMLKNELSGDVVSSLSQKAGVTEDQVKSGFSAGIPAVLAGILKNGASGDTSFLGNILSGVTGVGTAENPENLTHSEDDSLLDKGKSMLGSLFGSDTDSVSTAVSDSTGLSGAKATGLLAMIVPFITGYISKLMVSKGWSISELMGKIFESKSDIAAALPAGLGGALGLGSISTPNIDIPKVELSHVETPQVETPRVSPVNYSAPQAEKSGGGILKWLIPLLIILIAGWWLLGKSGCNDTKVNGTMDSLSANVDSMGNTLDSAKNALKADAAAAAETLNGKLNDAGDFVRDLGAAMVRKLPDGAEIKVAENSVESRLITFIEDKDKPVDKTTWFTFDRLYFETGKSTLKAESQEQLHNIAAILKAYPNVHLKLGGYTDNTGDATVNKKISTERANTAVQELVKLGLDPKRLEAEGYGQEHPVASNDTPEGQAQNRRIDIRVTNK
jgi:OOP family OmpA-OmpF porin